MRAFVDMCDHNTKKEIVSDDLPKTYDLMGTEELYKLMEHNKNHLIFMKYMGIFEDAEKMDIISNIRKINDAIGVKTGLVGNNSNINNVS